MRKLLIPLLSAGLFLLFLSCSEGHKAGDSSLNDDGLTKDITDFVPDSILAELENLGMPINGGDDPPNIQGYYYVSPLTLISSNRPNDVSPGYVFADYYVTFYNQDNKNLEVQIDYQNGGEAGAGIGSFIVGDGNDFSVFAELESSYSGYTAYLLVVITGTLTNTGISDFHYALLMLDNLGNPGGVWIENAEGRVFYDADGDSPKLGDVTKEITQDALSKISAGTIK